MKGKITIISGEGSKGLKEMVEQLIEDNKEFKAIEDAKIMNKIKKWFKGE